MNTAEQNLEKQIAVARKYGVALHQAPDYLLREQNIAAGYPLCSKCSGTGNQLWSMYQKCDECDGRGIAKL